MNREPAVSREISTATRAGPFSTTRTLDNPCSATDELSLNFPGSLFGKKQHPVCMTAVVLDGELVHQ